MKHFLKFWLSLPGFLTAIAALLTAIAAIYNTGFFRENSQTRQNITRPGYKEHEHPFHYDEEIKSMEQKRANDFCRERFDQLDDAVFRNLGIDRDEVNHVWGYKLKGACVANTQ